MNQLVNLRKLAASALMGVMVTVGQCAVAQTFPEKPIRIIVPVSPGGNLDAVTRAVALGMSRELGKAIVVDNQPGGRQINGTRAAAQAKPDGYTLLAAGVSFSVNAALYDNLPYRPLQDFVPVGNIGISPLLVVASPKLPVNNMQELIALAKAKPGILNYGSTGVASPAHIAGELLNTMAGVKITHIPYKDTQQASIDAMSGLLTIALPSATTVTAIIKRGQLKALGMGNLKRSPQLPGIPAIAETLPGFELAPWNGIMAPAGTPKAIILQLNAALNKAMAAPDIRAKLVDVGVDVQPMTPEEMASFVGHEVARFAKLVKAAEIKGER